jgi:hypothetical protein
VRGRCRQLSNSSFGSSWQSTFIRSLCGSTSRWIDRIVIWNGSLCASYGPCLPSRPCEAGRYPVLRNTMPPFTIHSPSPQSRIRATGDDASQLLGLSVYQSIASSVLTPTCLPHSSWTFRKRYRISSSHFARDHPCSHSAGVPRNRTASRLPGSIQIYTCKPMPLNPTASYFPSH